MVEHEGTAKSNVAMYVAIAVVCVGVAFLSLNQRGGPIEEVIALVESVRGAPSDTGPSGRTAAIRLPDGAVVQANVVPSATIQQGQAARVRVYQRVLSGTKSYELVGMEPSK